MRRGAKPGKAKVEPKRPVARKSPKNERSRVRQLQKRLAEAHEQQTATAEILRVISDSPADAQPVFDTIARNARRLCNADSGGVVRLDGGLLQLEALDNATAEGAEAMRRAYPNPVSQGTASGRAILTGRPVHIPDVLEEPEFEFTGLQGAGLRSVMCVPMLRQGAAIGVVAVHTWATPRPFTDQQMELLKTFADQAVIAIENVRLFTELQASNSELTTALDTQTATSDILRVISRSQTDVQPVFDAILTSAVHLLRAYTGAVTLTQNRQIELAALTSTDDTGDAAVRAAFPQSLQSVGAHPRAIRDRAPLNVADAHTDARLADGERAFADVRGFRSWVVVPMLRDAGTIGLIGVTRREAGGFTADEIALLQMFADQAVIAIENVRLFTELEARNRDLTESLEQQTATAEILRVISSSPTDLEPVLDAVSENASRLCEASDAVILLLEGTQLRAAAHHGQIFAAAVDRPATRDNVVGRAVIDRFMAEVAPGFDGAHKR